MCEHERLAVKAEFQRYADPGSDSDDLVAISLVVGARCDDCQELLPVVGMMPLDGEMEGFALLALETPDAVRLRKLVLPPGVGS